MVRIYFDTPTFDRIIEDERAKFEDMLSTIGGEGKAKKYFQKQNVKGTMGLLTGFSVISGVEILYFLLKFVISLFYRGHHK